MLAKTHRVSAPADFRRAMNKGVRVNFNAVTVYVLNRHDSDPSRAGFIVSKAVGNAVTRNVVKRRLRDITAAVMVDFPTGFDIVVRPLAGSDSVMFDVLMKDVTEAVVRVSRRGSK